VERLAIERALGHEERLHGVVASPHAALFVISEINKLCLGQSGILMLAQHLSHATLSDGPDSLSSPSHLPLFLRTFQPRVDSSMQRGVPSSVVTAT